MNPNIVVHILRRDAVSRCFPAGFSLSYLLFLCSYLNTGTKKQPAAREEAQVGFNFLLWAASFPKAQSITQ